MGLQMFRSDFAGPVEANGSQAWYTNWIGGPSLALIRQCPVWCPAYDLTLPSRTAYVEVANPETYHTIPACIRWKKKRVEGCLEKREEGWVFRTKMVFMTKSGRIKMKIQDMFDTIVNHLRKQGKKAEDAMEGGFLCKYLDEKGNKCAVGCLIPSVIYNPVMEGVQGRDLINNFPELKAYLLKDWEYTVEDLLWFLADMQEIHDYTSVNIWEIMFERVAKTRKVIYNPPK